MPTLTSADRVVDALLSAGLIDPARSAQARGLVAGTLGEPTAPRGARSRLVEAAGYLGGALVVAALGLFLAQSWSGLDDSAQVTALGVITGVLLVAGLAVVSAGTGRRLLDGAPVRRRLASALLVAAAFAASMTVLVGWTSSSPDLPEDLGWGVSLLLVTLTAGAYAVAHSALGQLVGMGALGAVILSGVDRAADGAEPLVVGVLFLAAGLAWLGLTETGVLREEAAGRWIGAAAVLLGAQLPVFDDQGEVVGYALTVLVAVLGFGAFVRTVSGPYLVLGVAAVTLVVPEAAIDWADGSLGTAGGVLVAGVTLLGASVAGLRVREGVSD